MKYEYPLRIKRQDDGTHLVTFPDIPEALTDGDSFENALFEASDCLVAALGGYVNEKRDIPKPSVPKADEKTIALPPLVSAKLALYQAMRDAKITRVALGKKLGISEGAVRRLLDLDHRSHIGQIDEVLAVLGKRLIVEVDARNAA